MNLDFSNNEVLVIGDVMLDHYIFGSVHRQSPEAPVPVVSQSKSSVFPGGAANVAINILGLGAKVNLIGIVGNDLEADQLSDEIKKAGILGATLIRDPNRCTTRKTRVIADNNHIVRVDHENTRNLEPAIADQVLSQLRAYLENKKIDVVILQDYNKGLFTKELIQDILKCLDDAKIPFVVDPKKKNIFEFKNARILKPNLKELREAFPESAQKDWKLLARQLFIRNNPNLLLVTLGEDGIWCYDGHKEYSASGHTVNDPDVCGAGDAVISIAALAECSSYEIKDLMSLCNVAGAVACSGVGVKTVTLNEIRTMRLKSP